MMTRREALKVTLLATVGTVALSPATRGAEASGSAGPFSLPPLPYPFDALEPHIDARTMEIHHDKHHATYVANLNKAVADTEFAKRPIQSLLGELSKVPENIRTTVRNNAGGHYNHSLFWQMMKKGGGGSPSGDLAKKIDESFGGYDGFKKQFSEAATKVFGSGWAWLVSDPQGKLAIVSTPNQDSPLMALPGAAGTGVPLLGLDVWEHAYYLKYQNRRADYIAAWFNVINWEFVADRYSKREA
jgi:Fe-Mn family superoxide dismutase